MCGKILVIVFVLIALILAVLGVTLPPERIDFVVGISKFFDIMLPVLAVGALLKFLCKGSCGSSCGTKCGTGCTCGCCKKDPNKTGTCSTTSCQ